jgi:hypothetical protein
VKLAVGSHLENKSPEVRETVEKILAELHDVGDVTIESVKTVIQVKAGATFLSMKPKKDHVEIEFQLGREIREFPVYRSLRVSRNRVVHLAVIEDPADVDSTLVGWLRESYELIHGD